MAASEHRNRFPGIDYTLSRVSTMVSTSALSTNSDCDSDAIILSRREFRVSALNSVLARAAEMTWAKGSCVSGDGTSVIPRRRGEDRGGSEYTRDLMTAAGSGPCVERGLNSSMQTAESNCRSE